MSDQTVPPVSHKKRRKSFSLIKLEILFWKIAGYTQQGKYADFDFDSLLIIVFFSPSCGVALPEKSQGYIQVFLDGGLNQQRMGVSTCILL